MTHNVILASGSAARQQMLEKAGVDFDVCPADIDEEDIMKKMEEEGLSSDNICLRLAQEKALVISKQNHNKYIIGSDQVLSMDNKNYSKVNNKKEAFDRLSEFQGQEHFLTSAVCIAKDGEILWHKTDVAALRMKTMNKSDIQNYIDKAGGALTSCVGCYALEEVGIRLFKDIRGDFFTILGMPLLPLLNFLEKEGVLS